MNRLIEISELYGGLYKVVEAVEAFGRLESLKNEVGKLEDLKRDLISKVNELKEKISKLERQKSEVESVLKIYDELKRKGFSSRRT